MFRWLMVSAGVREIIKCWMVGWHAIQDSEDHYQIISSAEDWEPHTKVPGDQGWIRQVSGAASPAKQDQDENIFLLFFPCYFSWLGVCWPARDNNKQQRSSVSPTGPCRPSHWTAGTIYSTILWSGALYTTSTAPGLSSNLVVDVGEGEWWYIIGSLPGPAGYY